ncbi:hypothetical protein HaLaN_06701 [Haematococcus lacustris]|uniref:Uncharacterized protein n=1 Tax=Haematococcus lacustris TaxID=44745 RepID=A0A699Z6W9_HAELA|nr:hypothetical protein HaLaN_06701 [Haematococcus lacustris]
MAEAVATTSGLQQNAHVHWPFAGIATVSGFPSTAYSHTAAGTAAGITAEGRGICLYCGEDSWRQLVYAGVAWLGDCKQGGSGARRQRRRAAGIKEPAMRMQGITWSKTGATGRARPDLVKVNSLNTTLTQPPGPARLSFCPALVVMDGEAANGWDADESESLSPPSPAGLMFRSALAVVNGKLATDWDADDAEVETVLCR